MAKITWTRTDEAPLLATYSLKPIVEAFASTAGIDVETRDISLAARIAAQFPERLTEEQKVEDALAELGDGQDPGSKYHQAAEYFRFPGAAEEGHRGAAGCRLRPA